MDPRGIVVAPDLGVTLDRWLADHTDRDRLAAVVTALADSSESVLNLLVANAPIWSRAAAALTWLGTAAAWSGPYGDVLLEVAPTVPGTHRALTIRFAPDGVRVLVGALAEPAVAVALDVRALVDLTAGRSDGALLFLADRLRVAGDTRLLLGLGAALRTPGAGTALIDPRALDPEAVSAAIKDVGTEHLDAVMAGGFRDLVFSEVFRRLPGFVDNVKAARARLTVGFEVGGRADGAVDRYVVLIREGTCTVEADPAGELPTDVSLLLTGAQFLRLVLGHLNPVRAVLGGQVVVRGEMLKALAFNSVIRIPGI